MRAPGEVVCYDCFQWLAWDEVLQAWSFWPSPDFCGYVVPSTLITSLSLELLALFRFLQVCSSVIVDELFEPGTSGPVQIFADM